MELYHVDTHYPGSENRTLAVVLYGELGTSEFSLFHHILKQYAQEGAIDYVVRHYVKVSYIRTLNSGVMFLILPKIALF